MVFSILFWIIVGVGLLAFFYVKAGKHLKLSDQFKKIAGKNGTNCRLYQRHYDIAVAYGTAALLCLYGIVVFILLAASEKNPQILY